MIFLKKTRRDVKVTVTCKWYKTLLHPTMHSHTKFGIPISNYKRDMLPDTSIIKTRSEVKVTVTRKWYKTLNHPKMHSTTKFGILFSNNIRDMLLTQLLLTLGQRSRLQWPENNMYDSAIPRCIYTPNLEFLPQRI